MKKEFSQKIEIPEGVEANIDGNILNVKGKEGENSREFNLTGLILEKKENYIEIGSKKATKREKKMINTLSAHVRNMIKGVQEKFEYKLKACTSHFPITVSVQGNEVLIKNFLGEKTPRKLKIKKGAEVKVEGDMIKVSSTNKEIAGQVAADIETATKIRARDRRVFQDGIWITHKAGEEI